MIAHDPSVFRQAQLRSKYHLRGAVLGARVAGSHQQLLTAAALLGVTGQSENNIGRIFRGSGVVLMVFDAFVAAGAVASPSSSLAAGSDLGATSALSSSCADGRSRRRVMLLVPACLRPLQFARIAES